MCVFLVVCELNLLTAQQNRRIIRRSSKCTVARVFEKKFKVKNEEEKEDG